MAQILIVDHTPQSRESLTHLLSINGNFVNRCGNADEGLRALQQQPYDVVFLDLQAPDKDFALLKKIQNNHPKTLIIGMSSFPAFSSVQWAMKEGVFDYLTKPINNDEVRFILERAIEYKQLKDLNDQLGREISIKNKTLEHQSQERAEEMALVYKIGQEISSHLDLSKVLRTLVNKVTELLEAEMCSVLLIDQEGLLSIKAACGLDQDSVLNTRIAPRNAISGWVLANKEAILVKDIENDQRFAKRNNEKYYTHSFISVPLVVDDEAIGVLNINNKRTKEIFTEDNLRLVKALASQAAIAIENARLYTALEGTYLHTVMALTSAVDMKDHYTRHHSEHVTKFGVAIAKEMGMSKDEVNQVKQACLLHDLGKIGIHDNILTKPGQLSDSEWQEIRQHPIKGAMILKPLHFLGDIIKLVEQHHERYDGSGYPFGLKGEEILLGARIMAVADSYDAMVTKRPYRDALLQAQAREELLKNSGTQFDPKVVDTFLAILDKQNFQIED